MTTAYTGYRTHVNVKVSYNGVGVRIKVARLTCGKTTHQLADDIGVNITTIQRYENGFIDSPNPAKLFAIADACEVSAYWLLSGIGKPSSLPERNEAIQFCIDGIEVRTEPIKPGRP